MPNVSDIMDREPVTVSPDTDVKSLIEVLQKNELPGVPVVDADNKVLGIVTDSDLVISDEEADFHLPHYVNIMGGIVFLESTKHFEERAKKAFASDVEEMMTSEHLVTVGPDEPAEHAARKISEKHHNRLPVVDGDGKLVGVVTRVDVLAALTGD